MSSPAQDAEALRSPPSSGLSWQYVEEANTDTTTAGSLSKTASEATSSSGSDRFGPGPVSGTLRPAAAASRDEWRAPLLAGSAAQQRKASITLDADVVRGFNESLWNHVVCSDSSGSDRRQRQRRRSRNAKGKVHGRNLRGTQAPPRQTPERAQQLRLVERHRGMLPVGDDLVLLAREWCQQKQLDRPGLQGSSKLSL
eukprot:TRINITY_DN24328_c0_g1_i1.p1 TRINITY_DN24328_c0_g1~~TRINITY_DN24328_c0_g1_i1.p1  ORF type:complete len:198 (-),score=32.22 TRINITY_DN24328_c0_g1_i1:184-777(-)